MDKEIQALRKQKSCVKGKLTKIANFVKAVTGETTLAEIQSRITSCHALLTQFNHYDEKIIMLNPEEDGDLTFEDDYHTTVAMLMTWARKKSVAEQAAPAPEADNTLSLNTTQFNLSTESDLKLPKLNIPKFSGNYTEWPSFFDLYSKTIHESRRLSAAQKFQYLKSLLDGEAASLLRHLLVTENNYKIALTKLQDRYDRKRHIITAFIRKFIDQPNIHHSNANALKKLMDTSEEVVRGLEALGSCAEARDPWLIYLLLEKLDDKTRAAWANYSTDSEDPKFVDFIKFLSRRIDAFETITSTTKRYSSRNDAKGHVTTQNEESSLSSATLSYKCAYCSSQDHSVLQCDKFRALDTDKRIQFIRDDHRCFNCLSKSHQVSRCSSHRNCQKCNRRHHTLLHQMQTASHSVSINDEVLSDKVVTDEDDEFNGITAVCNSISQCLAVLPTISLKVINSTGGVSTCRALLDSGSQISLITNSCVQRLNLNKEYSSLSISGVGQSNSEKTKGLVRLSLKTENQTILQMVAFVLPRITCRLPAQSFAVDMKHIKTVQLADPQFNQKSEVDILIGADFFFEIIRDGIKRIENSQLYLQNTMFGWVVAGRKSNHKLQSNERVALSTSMDLIQLDTTLRLFWEVESVGDGKAILSPEEKMCEDHFAENTIRHKNGRFILKLPFRTATTQIGNTYSIALRRFHSLENRFSRNLEFKKMYSEFMKEYIFLGHMVEITSPQVTDQSYYLPHHGVLKSTTAGSKLRVVFDGSAQPFEGKSLNSCLAVGPTVQASLFSILLRFRERRYVFSTDVEKMYRQILMAEVDTDFQRIIWRDDPSNEIKHYRLQTVTYGLSSAPFLATRALKQIAIDVAERYPKVTATINECVYVDDIMTGADTIEEASTIRNDLKGILSEYGFELRKWKSNCEKLLQDIPPDHCEARENQFTIQHRDDRNTVKILGLCWDPQTDELTFNVNLPHHEVHSKRTALSDASRLFDPVGWAAPVVIRMKIFVQQLWMKNLEWDDPLPDNLKTEWLQLREDLLLANSMSIPRYLTTINTSVIELHGFCDASKLAYAAAVYFKISTAGETTVRLITAKTKVAPTKQLSIPKLELAGALLLSRLLKNVMAETRITIAQIHAWTDSKDVLDWLSDYPSKWPTFVGNRTAEILTILPRSCWKHVPSEFNPADCASRGMSPKTLKLHTIWWHGPQWLSGSSDNWPGQPNLCNSALVFHVQCQVLSVPLNNTLLDEVITKYRSFEKSQYILCYITRFISNARRPKNERIFTLIPEPEETLRVLNMICRYEQRRGFSEEIDALRNCKGIPRNSILISLNPFLDENQVLRVGGRLENSECTYDKKHPIIIHSTSTIVKPILFDIHLRYKHAGPSLLVSILRQTFWIPSIKSKAKGLVRNCVICQRNKASLRSQIMANLPSARVIAARPFVNCGVDYAGPLDFHIIKGRGQRTYHGYMCIFVCLTTKAVHIEFATDLTSECFVAALKRFVARRGVPQNMFSDNGRNFIGAEAKLKQHFHKLAANSEDVLRFSTTSFIKWHFIPPQAPHFGGIWESAVKATKFHLKRVIGNSILTMEEMVTLLTEVEGILNSRPLCTTTDPNIEMLTPSHFLIGHSGVKIPEKDLSEHKLSHLTRWQMIQKMTQHFWNRWHLEYLSTLQTRNKWRNVKEPVRVNDIVIIHEKHVPSCRWPLGRVMEVHPGPDGYIRVVTLKTAGGMLQRPIHKICVLPVSDPEPDNRSINDQPIDSRKIRHQ